MNKQIVSLVEEMQSDPSKYLENFRKLDELWIEELWQDSSFDKDNIYPSIAYFVSECDHLPKGPERKNFSNQWLETCDKEEKEFFEINKQKLEEFFEDFFKYIPKMIQTVISDIVDNVPGLWPEFKENLFDYVDNIWEARFSTQVCAFCQQVSDMLGATPPDPRLQRILEMIENVLVHNQDEEVEGLLQVCFFESIINSFAPGEGEKKGLFEVFVSFIGPESKRLCRENDAFWGTKSPFIYDE